MCDPGGPGPISLSGDPATILWRLPSEELALGPPCGACEFGLVGGGRSVRPEGNPAALTDH